MTFLNNNINIHEKVATFLPLDVDLASNTTSISSMVSIAFGTNKKLFKLFSIAF